MKEGDNQTPASPLAQRFRGFLPVVVDVETGGFNCHTDAVLEIAAATLDVTAEGRLIVGQTRCWQVHPFAGANLEPSALAFTGIDPDDPDRKAQQEDQVFGDLFKTIRQQVRQHQCTRAILVGHNAHFDLGFVQAAAERCGIRRNPFHPFSVFDTATLAGLAFGHTVLARACELAGIPFDPDQAHNAAYDTARTAELFCLIVNRWQSMGGWPLPQQQSA